MLNVKKYRAASTREALQQIKNELGENALVLETKQVRKGGFLGFGAGQQVEISAAVPGNAVLDARPEAPVKPVHSTSILNLTDDTPARPLRAVPQDDPRLSLMAALSARAAVSPAVPEREPADARAEQRTADRLDVVELSPDGPKIVHPRREGGRTMSATDVSVSGELPASSNRELELLRAELREIKFSVNSFAGRASSSGGGVLPREADLNLYDEVFESPYYETYMELAETGIAPDYARRIVTNFIPVFRSGAVHQQDLSHAALYAALTSDLRFLPDLLGADGPQVIAMIGATGVGKTTTIAKLAARAALKERRRVELVTLDTYRIAAVEQLKTYAEIIGAGCHIVRTVLELDGLIRRLPSDSLILIDTTGKNPHDLADQYELADYLRARTEIRKCLAVQSTTHPVDALAGIRKFEMYGADSLIITKIDETLRPGSLLEVLSDAGLPLACLCHGQRVPEDIQTATAETMTKRILGKK